MKAGVIGLGAIGGGVAICLARSGQLAAVYDVRPDASAKLDGVPVVSATPALVARDSDVVLIAVVDAKQTLSVLEGPDGILSQARPGLSVVLLSTVSLEDLTKLRTLTEGVGVDLIDCGVTGGPAAAHNGLVCLAGGTDAAMAKVQPILDGFAKGVYHMGGPGAGMAAKIARNTIVYNVWQAGAEATRLAKASGVDLVKLADAIDSSSENVAGPTMWMRRPDPATDAGERRIREGISVLMSKDLAAAIDLGRTLDIALPTTQLTQAQGRAMLAIDDSQGANA